MAVSSVAASQLQGPRFDPELEFHMFALCLDLGSLLGCLVSSHFLFPKTMQATRNECKREEVRVQDA